MTSSVKLFGFAMSVGFGLLTAVGVLKLFPQYIPIKSPIEQPVRKQKPTVIGFLPYWLLNSVRTDSFSQLNVITYFGLEIDTDGTLVRKSNPKEAEPGWHKLENGEFTQSILPRVQSGTRYSLLVHQMDEEKISTLLEDPQAHAVTLVTSVEPIMKQHGFTDLNLDIESFREASPDAQERMTTFLTVVKQQLSEKNLGTLTTELTVASLIHPRITDPAKVGKVSDSVVLMAYDFRYAGSYLSGAVAPMGGRGETIEYDVPTSVELATHVIPPEKLILGIPMYGYEWETLSYDPQSSVIPGTGKTATATRVSELVQRCREDRNTLGESVSLADESSVEASITRSSTTIRCIEGRDELTGSPYLILPPNEDSAIRQIYYEDQTSLQKKLELANQYKLGGVAFWAIGYESPQLLESLKKYVDEW